MINHNVPTAARDYIHRVGRTARAGRGGVAVTLVTPHDVKLVKAIEERIGVKLQVRQVKELEWSLHSQLVLLFSGI